VQPEVEQTVKISVREEQLKGYRHKHKRHYIKQHCDSDGAKTSLNNSSLHNHWRCDGEVNTLVTINEVTLCQAQLVLGWVTVSLQSSAVEQVLDIPPLCLHIILSAAVCLSVA